MIAGKRDWRSVLLVSLTLVGSSCRDTERARQVKQFYLDGKLKVVATFRGNQMHGRTIWYYPTGGIEQTSNWVAGKQTGVTRHYYASGVLQDSLGFWQDTLHGRCLRYY